MLGAISTSNFFMLAARGEGKCHVGGTGHVLATGCRFIKRSMKEFTSKNENWLLRGALPMKILSSAEGVRFVTISALS